jgi:hypothetical protein
MLLIMSLQPQSDARQAGVPGSVRSDRVARYGSTPRRRPIGTTLEEEEPGNLAIEIPRYARYAETSMRERISRCNAWQKCEQ